MSRPNRLRPPPPRRRAVSIQLPPVAPDEALLLVDLLQRALRAAWRAYGEALAAEQDDYSVADSTISSNQSSTDTDDDPSF